VNKTWAHFIFKLRSIDLVKVVAELNLSLVVEIKTDYMFYLELCFYKSIN